MNEPSEAGPLLASRFSTRALFNSGLRSVFWLLLVGVLLFFIPEYADMSSEYGVELSDAGKYVISLSHKAIKSSFVFVPLVILALIIAELGLLSIPRGPIRGILNKLAWLVLLIAIILYVVAVGIPWIAMITGLSGEMP